MLRPTFLRSTNSQTPFLTPQMSIPISTHWPFATSVRQKKEIRNLFSPESLNACSQKGMSGANNRRLSPRGRATLLLLRQVSSDLFVCTLPTLAKQQCCPLLLPGTYSILFLFHSSVPLFPFCSLCISDLNFRRKIIHLI